MNQKLFSVLPGYTGSNVQEPPKEAQKDPQLTLRELEQAVVRFIVHRYNPDIDARMGDQSRYQRWESGLIPHLSHGLPGLMENTQSYD